MNILRTIMTGKEYELFKIVEPYLCIKNGKMSISESAPEKVKKAYDEYIKIPPEPDVF